MNIHAPHLVFLTVVSISAPLASAATWDFGGTPDKNWSTVLNWSDDASAAGKAVLFNDTAGATANATTVGSIMDASLTIDSLAYANSGTTWQVTQIASGTTFTLNGSLSPTNVLSVSGGAVSATNAAITGATGTLAVNKATANIFVGNSSTGPQTATLDMSGLGTFTATVNEFQLGVGVRGIGIVNLAAASTITASKLRVGDVTASTTAGSPNKLNLGGSNTLNVDTIALGTGYASGSLAFRTGLPTTSSVTIRAKDGSGRADLAIGNTNAITLGNTQSGTADFTGGTVDALINNLTLAKRSDTGGGLYSGTLSMSRGTIDATTVVVGQTLTAASGSQTTTGTINVSGGTFTAGSILMAQNLSGARTGLVGNLNVSGTGAVAVAGDVTTGDVQGTGTVTANVAVSGGTLTVGGNLGEGSGGASVTSAVTLSGGTLDMTHGNIVVDTFTFTGGTLKNVASFTAGTSGGLNVQTASTLSYDVDASFASTVLTGALTLGASSNLQLTLGASYMPSGNFLLVDNDGSDSVVGTFATINGVAFGVGNSFTLTNNTGSYDFTLNYSGGTGNDLIAQLVSIPEPSAYAVLVGACGLGLAVLRRRRR